MAINAHLDFQEAGGRQGFVFADAGSNSMRLRRYAGGSTTVAEIAMFEAGYITASTDIRGQHTTPSSTSNTLTSRSYVDDNVNVVQQAGAYEMVMPAAAPTAGQTQQVASVSGITVTMALV